MDGGSGAVPFQAAHIAAIAGASIDVDADVADFRRRALVSIDDASMVDDAQANAFAEQIIGEVVGFGLRVEQIFRKGSGARILLDERGDAERMGEFVKQIDRPPSLHGGDYGGAPNLFQVRAGNGHAHRHDGRIRVDEPSHGIANRVHGFRNMFLAHRRQVGEGKAVALQIEYGDLHQTAGELHADDMVFRAIEVEADGTAILAAVHVAGFLDDAVLKELRGDFRDCRRCEIDGFGDLRPRADAVAVQMLEDSRAVVFGDG